MKRKRILYSAVAAIVLLGAGFTLYHPPKTFLDKTPPLIFQNGKGYQKEWAKVDSLWKKRLTRSALEVVDEIHKKAKDENNSPQIAKALIHKLKFESNIEEENYIKAIYDLSVEIDNSYFPLKPVLHSFLAEIYWRYYQNNRWKFLNRTETVAFKNDDIRTWDLKKIVQETMTHYNLSLQSADSLKRTRISHFNDILLLGDSAGRKLRPTLYDFLAHRASGFFMHEEPGLTKPAYKFELAEPWYFDESE
ncbi:hypothetical protein JYU20_04395, partial [Bacteroidales bacterium AH-315-I05]|nr:hypothetical protein [Bacteroidales bacterium AH-315-I05]